MLLISLDFVDYLCWVLLLYLGRGCQQALNIMEYCAFEELRPSCSFRLLLHLVCQVFKGVQEHRQDVLHGEFHKGVLKCFRKGVALRTGFGSCHENPIRYV